MTAEVLTGLAMAVILLAAAALATRPWWRGGRAPVPDRKAANIAAYRLRLGELETEASAGLIPADEAENLRAELDARLLSDAGDAAAEPPAPDGRRPLAVIVVVALLALFAAGGYVASGSWRVQQEIARAEQQPKLDPKIVAMVDKLAGRLKEKPEDPRGWAMLGRSYFAMQRYDDAAQAYDQANSRAEKPDPAWLTDESEALTFAGNREVSGRAAELVEQALRLAPDYGKALWYGGLAAAQAGDLATARSRWQKLLQADDLPESMRTALDERLKAIDAALARAPEAGVQADAQPAAAPAAAGPGAGPGLRIAITLAPALASRMPAGATLFVFAKAESGPQIPLAVQRLPAAKLPLTVTLDDSMAMAPALRLSQFERYVVTARLSAAGGVRAQSGDLEGRIDATRAQAGAAPLALTIDQVVP